MGQRIGYRRVSTLVQNTARQLEGVDVDRVFEDKLSGGTRARPGLEAMLEHLRAGDEVHVHSIDRLARDLGDRHLAPDGAPRARSCRCDSAERTATERGAGTLTATDIDLETLDYVLGEELVALLEEYEDLQGEIYVIPPDTDSSEDAERRNELEIQCRDAENDISQLLLRTRMRLRRDPARIAALIDANGGFR